MRFMDKRIFLVFMAVTPAAVDSRADYFEYISSIHSAHGVCYSTMDPNNNYLAMGNDCEPHVGLEILDISNPGQMISAGFIYSGLMSYYLEWDGGFIYSPAGVDGLKIYDVADFGDIRLASQMAFDDALTGIGVRDNTAIAASSDNGSFGGLYCIDVTDPYNPAVVWSSDTLGCSDIYLGQFLAYTFSWCTEIKILNITDIRSPRLLARISCPLVNAIDVDEGRHLMYATCFDYGLLIFEISNPQSPRLLSTTPMPDQGIGIDVRHSKICAQIVFISELDKGLRAMDTTDPIHPFTTAFYRPQPEQCVCVLPRGNMVFLSAFDSLYALEYHCETEVTDGDLEIPSTISLSQNYPNPFNGSTIISVNLSEFGNVRLEIYDIMGRKVSTLLNGFQPPGEFAIQWDASDYPSGIYLYRVSSNNSVLSRKMSLAK